MKRKQGKVFIQNRNNIEFQISIFIGNQLIHYHPVKSGAFKRMILQSSNQQH